MGDAYGRSIGEFMQVEWSVFFLSIKHAVRITQEEIALIESRYFPDESPRGLFRQCK